MAAKKTKTAEDEASSIVAAQEKPPVESALTPQNVEIELNRWRDEQARWEKDEASTRDALQRLEQGAAGAVLSNRSKMSAVTQKLAELRARVEIASQAATEAKRRADMVAHVLVRFQAEALQPQVDEAFTAVEEHKAETARLLKQLEEFTRATYRRWTIDDELDRRRREAQPMSFSMPTSVLESLGAALRKVERRQAILFAAAADQDLRETFPGITFDDLPDALRPGGVLPVAGFKDPAAELDARASQLREELVEAEEDLAQAVAVKDAAEDAESRDPQDFTVRSRSRDAQTIWDLARQRRDRIRGELVQAGGEAPTGEITGAVSA